MAQRNVQNEIGRVMNSIKLQDYEMKYGYTTRNIR